ncbi:hypothetical protein KUCAC02_018875 [Chaenocephalus aceratus]|uniref:Uncharacterized protein n=1 Tax=Chaenocephalus aceratus TaxID=36190 RepID=A0ACB9WAH6_CHAAC|nr:hypothetical protein KUCAC02_018875 [Chaenocephalus aceratus]
MLQRNCSLTALFTVLSDVGCSDASVEDEYLSMHLGPVKSPVFLPVCVTYLPIFMVGVLGNALTCTVILRNRAMQTPTNYYLMSLAVSDLLTVCFASILNVTALSVERYMVAVHPLKVKHMTTHVAHVKRVIFMLWRLSMLCAVPNTSLHGIVVLPSWFGREFPRSAICHVMKPTWVYNLIILISTFVFFLLPMMIISILYLIIRVRLQRDRLMTVVDTSFGPESLSRSHKQKLSRRNVQVTNMLCVLVIVFGLCWAPFHVDRLMWSYIDPLSEQHLQVFELVHIVSGVFFYLSSAINPILYNLMSTRFREMFSHVTCYHNSWPARFSQQMTQRSTLSEKRPSST